MNKKLRHTKIIATIGPATCDPKMILKSIKAGANLFRINASHSNPATIKNWIKLIQNIAKDVDEPVAIMLDLQGPRLRTGTFSDTKEINLKKGEEISIYISKNAKVKKCITTPNKIFMRIIKKNSRVLLDNGHIELKVLKKYQDKAVCRVMNTGVLGENKGINIPDSTKLSMGLTAKDKKDLKALRNCAVDFIALSFVRKADDVVGLKKYLKSLKKEIPVVAKIEKPEALNNIEAIMDVSDGIIVARGDLGIELGVERVPPIQKKLVNQTNQTEIPVIVATQMLESMTHNMRPTRAEVSDVANAIFEGADAVMLSGETAAGKYPIEAIEQMEKIIQETKKHIENTKIDERIFSFKETSRNKIDIHAITVAAVHAAHTLKSKAIIVFSFSGKTVRLVSKLRPLCPIIALTPSESLCRKLTPLRSVTPITIDFKGDTDTIFHRLDRLLIDKRILKRKDTVVAVSGRLALPGTRFMTKVYRIGD